MINNSENHKLKFPKICFAASSGGHLEEILCLRQMLQKCPHFFLTEKIENISGISDEDIVYYIPQLKRSDSAIVFLFLKAVVSTIKCFRIEHPDIIVSTGALSTIPAMYLGHFFGAKVIYIESQARVKSLSLTGKFARHISDLFFVQWESLLQEIPEGIYKGMLS